MPMIVITSRRFVIDQDRKDFELRQQANGACLDGFRRDSIGCALHVTAAKQDDQRGEETQNSEPCQREDQRECRAHHRTPEQPQRVRRPTPVAKVHRPHADRLHAATDSRVGADNGLTDDVIRDIRLRTERQAAADGDDIASLPHPR
jgi:hypothetical protein